jgi:hypothetical protein
MQIKGVGANDLAGNKSTDYFHAYGGASLQEGIRDALWGEICHIALPYGGVRVHGLIGTGTKVKLAYPRPGKNAFTPRTLIVREPAIRPAHYMRAIFHSPKAEMSQYVSDVERTRNAILSLPEALSRALRKTVPQESVCDHVEADLHEMFDRFAAQIATARAKRLMHGASSRLCRKRSARAIALRRIPVPKVRHGQRRSDRGQPQPTHIAATLSGIAQSGDPVYRVTVRVTDQAVQAYGRAHELKAGMLAEADIVQDTRKLWEWVLEPVFSLSGKVAAHATGSYAKLAETFNTQIKGSS